MPDTPDLRNTILDTILQIPDLVSYRVWHDNPLDGYSTVIRPEQDTAKLIANAITNLLIDMAGRGQLLKAIDQMNR